MAVEFKENKGFYTLVRNLREGFQFIQEDSRTIDVFPTAEEAFDAADESEDPNDIEVVKVQVLKRL